MGLLPLAGAVHVTVADPLPGTAATLVGCPGDVGAADGVTMFDGADGLPAPIAFEAKTVKL